MPIDMGLGEAAKYGGGGSGDRFEFKKGDNRIKILAVDNDYVASHFINNKPVTCIGIKEGCPYHGANAPMKKNAKGEPVPVKPSIKKLAYVYSFADKAIKMAYLPYTIVKELQRLSSMEDWAFDAMPMPYPIIVAFDADAAPNDMYKVSPVPKMEALDPAIVSDLNSKTPLHEIREKIKNKVGDQDLEAMAASVVTPAQAAEAMADAINDPGIPIEQAGLDDESVI